MRNLGKLWRDCGKLRCSIWRFGVGGIKPYGQKRVVLEIREGLWGIKAVCFFSVRVFG